MRKMLAALVALAIALPCAAMSQNNLQRPIDDDDDPQPTNPQPPAPAKPLGAIVIVPQLISGADSVPVPTQATRVMRMPAEAGRVSNMVATNLLAHGKSWIAKGDRYYSLCAPDGRLVACAPLVATSTIKDIEVGAYDDNGVPKLSFRVASGTTQDAKRLIATINYFLNRTAKQVAHFDRKAANKVTNSTQAKASTPHGINAPTLIAEGGGGCSYDDFGDYDCSGGDGGTDGAGYESDSYDWSDPDTSDLPPFPNGSDSGNADPCTDANGNNVCQQVVITGERAEEMALPVCNVTPWAIACTRTLPPVFDQTEQLPRGPTPWLPQVACDTWNVLCSAGQVPAAEEPPPLTDEERRRAARMRCYREANAALGVCYALKPHISEQDFEVCKQNALQQGRDCSTTGMDR